MYLCQEAFNRRLPVCCLGSVMNVCSLLIPEYSGIKRRGKPLPGQRNACISFISFSIQWEVTIYHPLPFYEPYGNNYSQPSLFDMDCLMFLDNLRVWTFDLYLCWTKLPCKTVYIPILCWITPLLHQSLGPRVFLSFSFSFFLSLSPANSLEPRNLLCSLPCPGF